MSESSEVVHRFMEEGMHLTPEALETVQEVEDSEIDHLLTDLEERRDRPSIVTEEIVTKILESSEETITTSEPTISSESSKKESREIEEADSCDSSEISSEAEEGEESSEPEVFEEAEEEESEIEVLRDITGNSTTEGKVEDFVQLFRDRFEKIGSIIRSHQNFQSYTELGNVARHEGDMVNLVGLVNNKRETRKKDAWIVELEDLSGRAVIYVKDSERNEEAVEAVKKIVTDEVIGVKAKVPDNLQSGSRSPLVWGNEIFWPDVPVSASSSLDGGEGEENLGKAVLISDLHVGSSMFLEGAFEKFLEWLDAKAGNQKQRELAEEVNYLIVAGDLVDGIGIYPGQQKELDIEDVHAQYEKVAEMLSKVPDDIEIIAAPGNHDAVRLAEPQPAINPSVAKPLEDVGVRLVGNPALIDIEGVKFLIYHGMGFDDLISAQPRFDREHAVPPMEEALKRRHLAPIYGEPMGGKTPIAPEKEDYMVIDDIPDVLHCGHLHIYGCDEYRGILMVNSATFQEQTLFMKRQGIDPTPGHVPIVDLGTKEARAIKFA